jgi:hypothetical protein
MRMAASWCQPLQLSTLPVGALICRALELIIFLWDQKVAVSAPENA